MKAVFDNNILVRANPKNAGPARRLLQRFQSGPDVLILPREMLQELERVLLYPRLVKRFQMSAADVAAFLTELAESSTLVVPAMVPVGLIRDPTDEPILGTAVAGRADVLCTRDLDLCDDRVRVFAAEHGIRIIGDLELLALLDEPAADG
jgi:putative PIN family toxin of toxin-antitoxin system